MIDTAPYLVGIAPCQDYNPHKIRAAVDSAVACAGGWPPLSGNVLLKANLLAPRNPEDAVTTHPSVLRGAIQSLKATNPEIEKFLIADNPGYIFSHQKEMLFAKCGMTELERSGLATVELLSERGLVDVEKGKGRLASMRVSRTYLEATTVINAAKLKTHVETEITGCLKNIFGIADTSTRKRAHASRSNEDLCHAILEIFEIRPPEFHLLDAVTVMEGKGPSHGTPRHLGWILAGKNALAIDAVAAWMMGYQDPFSIPLLYVAHRRGIGPGSLEAIRLQGASWEQIRCPEFKRAPGSIRWIPTFLRGMVHRLVKVKPLLQRERCVRCGICATVCPVNAIALKEGYPVIDSNRCVSCLCCHEMCPPGAMTAKENFLARVAIQNRTRA
jgi:uncharacterized protein (DUF362 family)/Pyruvate/2-oxoacid:ferredoxin oxidoreductase delta subunit